jgi:hypothetical protein
VTIDASDASGNPLAGLAALAAPTPEAPFDAGADLGNLPSGDPVAVSPTSMVSSTAAEPAAVPEPATLLLLAVGVLALTAVATRRTRRGVRRMFDRG